MPLDRHESFDDDDDLALYLAAFREVEQPSVATRDANWRAIEAETTPSRRGWIWVGAAVTAAAAAWLVVQLGGDVLRLGDDEERGAREQAGYVHGDETGGEATTRAPAPRRETVVESPAVEVPVVEAPVVEAPVVEAPVVEAPVVEAPVVGAPADKPKPKPRTSGSLADETALFGDIQRALVDNQPARALEAIRRHEREFPRGAFRNERVVAKARALCAAGKTKAAIELRDRFLRQHEGSHLAPSMRGVCSP